MRTEMLMMCCQFHPELTEAFIVFSILGLDILGQKPDEICSAFLIWMLLRQPDLLTEKGKQQFMEIPEELRETVRNVARSDFFRVYTQSVTRFRRS